MSYSDLLSRDEICEIVKARLRSLDFKVQDVIIRPLGGAPVGFMSDHLRIRVTIQRPNEVKEELHFFAKTIPRNVPIHSDFVTSSFSYVKETALYGKLIPDLRRHWIPSEECVKNEEKRPPWTPECFFTRSDAIVLDDLSIYNFKTFNSRMVLDVKHCEVVLREIASFHAASIIFEEREKVKSGTQFRISDLYPDVFKWKINTTLDGDDTKGWFLAGVRTMLSLVGHLPKYQNDPDLCRLIREKIPDACDRLNDLSCKSERFRNVTCHGDLWCNNILFQYGDDGQPVDVRFVDFQLVQYMPPANDVLLFLHTTTSREFRERNGEALMGNYHDTLKQELRRHGIDIEGIVSRSEFDASCEELKELARILTALYHQNSLMKGEISTPLFASPEGFNRYMLVDRSIEVCDSFDNDPDYRWRMNEAMEEFIDCCVLNK